VKDSSSLAPDPSGRLLTSYQTLHEIARMLLGSASQEELLTTITRELKRLVPYDIVTIYQIDHVQGMFVPLHVVDRFEKHLDDHPFELGTGFTGQAVRSRRPLNLPRADLVAGGSLVPGTENDPESLAIVPLMVRDEPIATLNVSRLGEDVAYSAEEFDLICRFADLAALALDNTQHRDRLVKEAQTDGLTGLGNHRAFHERLREEVERAHRYRRHLSLVVFDLDDFKLLNDVHGHQQGDVVLSAVAGAACEGLRASDAAFRVGGEEFAILLPESSKRAAKAAADRLCSRVRALGTVRRMTVSCGVAAFPGDGANPTELLEAADAALYAAKERGKDRSASYSAAIGAARRRRTREQPRRETESLAQLKLLGLLAGKLNRLNDVWRMGESIVLELRSMVDYHNARVYLLAEDGETLEPVAFGGALSEYEGLTEDALRCKVGEGITGTAAERGQTLNVGNALVCEFAEDVEGTADIEESILAVPMRFEGRTVGVIVLSKLGLDQFSVLAVRLLELLAAQAAVSFENARLLEVERRNAQVSQALLEIATRAAAEPSTTAVAEHVCQTVERLTESAGAAVLAHESRSGRHRVVASRGESAVRSIALAAMHTPLPADGEVAVLGIDELPAVTSEASSRALFVAVVPLHRAVLVVAAESFSRRSTDTLAAVARQTTLALRNAELLGGGALDAAPAAPA
jgi:diguanylate cyclase (GGDEF)-like protein